MIYSVRYFRTHEIIYMPYIVVVISDWMWK